MHIVSLQATEYIISCNSKKLPHTSHYACLQTIC